jgi:hypothetical protein
MRLGIAGGHSLDTGFCGTSKAGRAGGCPSVFLASASTPACGVCTPNRNEDIHRWRGVPLSYDWQARQLRRRGFHWGRPEVEKCRTRGSASCRSVLFPQIARPAAGVPGLQYGRDPSQGRGLPGLVGRHAAVQRRRQLGGADGPGRGRRLVGPHWRVRLRVGCRMAPARPRSPQGRLQRLREAA